MSLDLQAEAKIWFTRIQAYGLWVVLLILLGFWFGVQYSRSTLDDRFDDATQLGGLIYKGKVYDVKERILQ